MQALLQGSLQQSTVKLAQLEGALSGLQQSFRMRNRFKQLAMLVIARNTPVSELQGLRELFQKLDIDNSGCLTLDELRRGLKLMDSEVSCRYLTSLGVHKEFSRQHLPEVCLYDKSKLLA